MHLPIHHRMRHPVTGLPLQAIGIRRNGTPIWPVMGGSQPTGEPAAPPAPPAPPVPPAPPAAPPAPPALPANPTQPSPPQLTVADGDLGFPSGTSVADMTTEQQLAYWRERSKKHENRNKAMADYDDLKAKAGQYDALLATTQTEHEKAIAEARRQGAAEATAKSNNQLVKAYVMAAVAGRLDQERVNTLLEGIDPGKFITGGDVDADKVSAFVAAFVPAAPVTTAPAAPTQQPPAGTAPATGAPAPTPPLGQPAPTPPAGGPPRDMGQGTHQPAPVNHLEAGRAEARRRHPKLAGAPAPAA